jgi:hypothetical protein
LDSRLLDRSTLCVDYWNQLAEYRGFAVSLITFALFRSHGSPVCGGLSLSRLGCSGRSSIYTVAPHDVAYLSWHAAGLKAAELQFRGVNHDSGTQFDGLRQPIIAFRQAEVMATR